MSGRAKALTVLLALMAAGCATPPAGDPQPAAAAKSAGPQKVAPAILAQLDPGTRRQPAPSADVERALMPPMRMEMPDVRGQPLDTRFDLSVNDAPAAQVFQTIVSGTRFSMLVHPEVSGNISLSLKDVTVPEAL